MENVLEQDGAEAPETPTEEHDEGSGGIDPEIEQRAIDMGWAPRDRWRGNPEDFVEADEYVRRGEHVIPIIRAEKRRLEEQLNETRGQLDTRDAEWQQRFDALERMNQLAMERQANQIRSEFGDRKRRAAENMDMDEYDRLDAQEREQVRELEEQTKQAAPKEPETKESGVDQATQRTLDNWKADNSWYSRDPVLKALAEGLFNQVAEDMPNADLDKQLQETTNRVMDAMPDKFNGGTRRTGNAVEGGSRTTGNVRGAKMAHKLPPEAKAAGEKFVKQELYKDLEEYASEYFKYE